MFLCFWRVPKLPQDPAQAGGVKAQRVCIRIDPPPIIIPIDLQEGRPNPKVEAKIPPHHPYPWPGPDDVSEEVMASIQALSVIEHFASSLPKSAAMPLTSAIEESVAAVGKDLPQGYELSLKGTK